MFSEKMEKSSDPSVSMDIPAEKQPGMVPPAFAPNPIWRMSPRDNKGSNLYDSFELQAVTKQLNRAIQGSNGPLSPYSRYLKSSPFYNKRLNRIHRENANNKKRISCSQADGSAKLDIKASARITRALVVRLWKKVTRGFTRSKAWLKFTTT